MILFLIFFALCGIGMGLDDIPGIDETLARLEDIQEQADTWQRRKTIIETKNSETTDVHLLHPDIEKLLRGNGRNRLEIFCYTGEPQTLVTLLKTVELVVSVPHSNFQYYDGCNASSIRTQFQDSSWLNFNPWKPVSFKMDLYKYSCIGIETSESFRATLKVRHLDLWRVMILSIGIGLFLLAPLLASNYIFHYATGISVGVCGSLLVIIFLVARLIPKKTGAVTVLVGGWGLVLYSLQYVWNNCLNLIKEYQSVVIGYLVVASLISFAVVYRYGPIKDDRSLHLVQWALQLLGLACIFTSSACKEFTVAIGILLLVHYNIPNSWTSRWRSYWLCYFPPKPHVLSEEEYLEQTRIETTKALDELRKFCHSPDCNAWKTMSRLATPQRFAEFVEGNSHLKDDEILSYETSPFDNSSEEELLTSDEDEGS